MTKKKKTMRFLEVYIYFKHYEQMIHQHLTINIQTTNWHKHHIQNEHFTNVSPISSCPTLKSHQKGPLDVFAERGLYFGSFSSSNFYEFYNAIKNTSASILAKYLQFFSITLLTEQEKWKAIT